MKFYLFLFVSLFMVFLVSAESPGLTNIPESSPSFGEDHFWSELLNMLITLGFILLVLIALVWIMKRMQQARLQQGNDLGAIQIIDYRPLSAKSAIYLMHINGRAIVISDSSNGVTQLAEFPITESND